MRFAFSRTFGSVAVATALAAAPVAAEAQRIEASVDVRTDQPGPVIERDVYGQFAEHLGRGIYEGVWVGEDSPIPNTQGYRNDVPQRAAQDQGAGDPLARRLLRR